MGGAGFSGSRYVLSRLDGNLANVTPVKGAG